MATVTVYGPGGYDPDRPDSNVVDVVEVPDPPAPSVAEQIAALQAQLDALAADQP